MRLVWRATRCLTREHVPPQTVIQGQDNISACNPVAYSHRLQDFMRKVFK